MHCSTSFNCSCHNPEWWKAACTRALTVIPEFSCAAFGDVCWMHGMNLCHCCFISLFTYSAVEESLVWHNQVWCTDFLPFFYLFIASGWSGSVNRQRKEINSLFSLLVGNICDLGLNVKCFPMVWPWCCNNNAHYVLPVLMWNSSRCSRFLQQPKEMRIRLTGYSKLLIGVNVSGNNVHSHVSPAMA